MKHILFIAPHSFPIKSSESICNSKVAYTLANAGYKVDVFCREDSASYPADKTINDMLSDSPNLRIITVKANHSLSFRMHGWKTALKNIPYNLRIFLQSGFFYRTISVAYDFAQAVEKEIKLNGHNPYDVIITRGFHTDYAGLYIAKKYGIKWIANWNDPYPVSRFPQPYGTGYDTKLPFLFNRLYKEMQKHITYYTYPNYRLRNYMLKCFTGSTLAQSVVIPHMAHSMLNVQAEKDPLVFRLVHCGDVRKPRDPLPFLKALSLASASHSVNIDCSFIGSYDSSLKEYIESDEYLRDTVHLYPPKKYAESILFISKCDVNLIIEAQCEEGIYLPTKFVDSIQCGLPVFCVSPQTGMLKDLTKRYDIGYCADNTSIEDIKNEFLRMIADYSNRQLPSISKEKLPEFFEDSILEQYKEIL